MPRRSNGSEPPSSRMVEPILKQGGKSPQRQRRAAWEREFRKGAEVARRRAGGRCEVCKRRPDTQTHHKKGRVGPDVNDPKFLLRVCLWCDHDITTKPEWAIENGYSYRRVT